MPPYICSMLVTGLGNHEAPIFWSFTVKLFCFTSKQSLSMPLLACGRINQFNPFQCVTCPSCLSELSNHSKTQLVPPFSALVRCSLCCLTTTTCMWWTWGLKPSQAAGRCQPTANPKEAPVSCQASPPGSMALTARTMQAWCLPPACRTIAFIWFFGRRMAKVRNKHAPSLVDNRDAKQQQKKTKKGALDFKNLQLQHCMDQSLSFFISSSQFLLFAFRFKNKLALFFGHGKNICAHSDMYFKVQCADCRWNLEGVLSVEPHFCSYRSIKVRATVNRALNRTETSCCSTIVQIR